MEKILRFDEITVGTFFRNLPGVTDKTIEYVKTSARKARMNCGGSIEFAVKPTVEISTAVRRLFLELPINVLHFGDCVGADAQAYGIAKAETIGALTIAHPPTNQTHRAFCRADVILPCRSYLRRDRDIVREGIDGLIAVPRTAIRPTNLRGEGTWTTIGYGEQAGRKIWLVYPDGSVGITEPTK